MFSRLTVREYPVSSELLRLEGTQVVVHHRPIPLLQAEVGKASDISVLTAVVDTCMEK